MIRLLLPLIVFSFCLSSCATYYGVANYTTESTVLQKPAYRGDTVTVANYISGTFHHSTYQAENTEYREKWLGSLQFHRARTQRVANYAYGAFVHAGNYDARTIATLVGGNQLFYGGGITAEANLNIPFESVDWRIIGAKMTVLTEVGDYAQFRKEAEELSGDLFSEDEQIVNLNPHNVSLNITATSELVFKQDNFDLGISTAIGIGHQFMTLGQKIYFSSNQLSVYGTTHVSIQGYYLGGGVAYQLSRR